MQITLDPDKNERNIRERNLPFAWASEFEFSTALGYVDVRKDYGETRYIALGMLHERLHVLCFAETSDGIRVISFRKANNREVKHYAKAHN